MPGNLYTAAWTIIQNCCAAAVAADVLNEPLIARHSNAAALRAASRIGVPECELRRIRELMMEELRRGTLRATGVSRGRGFRLPTPVNANDPPLS